MLRISCATTVARLAVVLGNYGIFTGLLNGAKADGPASRRELPRYLAVGPDCIGGRRLGGNDGCDCAMVEAFRMLMGLEALWEWTPAA